MMNMNYITFENHFWVPNKQINAYTRNKAMSDVVFIMSEIAKTLYPDENIEILFLPPEEWSYKDILKIVGVSIPVLTVVWYYSFEYLNYRDSHQEHKHNESMWVLEDTQKCIEFQKKIQDLSKEWYGVEWINEEWIKEICWDIKLTKTKNNFYNTLQEDELVASNEIVLVRKNKPIRSNKIPRNEFKDYVEYIPESEKIVKEDQDGIIELVSPVLLQQKEWKWKPWEWMYYWENILYNGIVILEDGETVKFYMQDNDFKKQIYNHEITFWTWDNMSVSFNLSLDLYINIVKNKNIYVKEVKKLNEEVIEHKAKLSKKKQKKNSEVMTLFDDDNY